jgi:hypothetical protein
MNKKYTAGHLETVVAVMDDLADRMAEEYGPKAALESYRETDGSAAYRSAVMEIATTMENYFEGITDDARQAVWDCGCWDFEWIPSVINWLHLHTAIDWWEASTHDINLATIAFKAAGANR